MPDTVVDFWKMLWDNSVKVVVMACNEYEGSPRKVRRFSEMLCAIHRFNIFSNADISQLYIRPVIKVYVIVVSSPNSLKPPKFIQMVTALVIIIIIAMTMSMVLYDV